MLVSTLLAVALGSVAVLGNPTPGTSPLQKRGINPPGKCGGPVDPGLVNEEPPVCVYNYNVGTGAIDCNPLGGKVSKAPTNNGQDITTLVTFEYTAAMAGKPCRIGFKLTAGDTSAGTKQFQFFSSLAPAPGCTASWPPGNQRNIHLSTVTTALDGSVVWLTNEFTCPPDGTKEGYELVGVGDSVEIGWTNPATSGPRVFY